MKSLRRRGLRQLAVPFAPLLDVLGAPGALAAGVHLRLLREAGIEKLPRCRRLLTRIGIFPIRDHYYEPLFATESLRGTLDQPRDLPGLDLRLDDQLERLVALRYTEELQALPRTGAAPGHFAFDNGNFGPGDAEILYSLVRQRRPRRIVEIGSGYSTLVVRHALAANAAEGASECDHVCVEPYEMSWLEATGARIVREKAESLEPSFFGQLGAGDMLFIDSSHMVRPGGDVLFLLQRIVPRVAPGVLIHVHDVFTPFDYPERWLVDRVCFWNEQYLLETFLACNPDFRVVLSLYGLFRNEPAALFGACPVLHEVGAANPPKSFWFERRERHP